MTWGDDGQGIFGVGLADSTKGLWLTDGYGYIFVASDSTIGYLTKGPPYLTLKGRAPLVKGKSKILAFATEVLG